MSTKGFRDLIAWQKAMDLVESIYSLSASWPKDERFGLTSQVRRAAVSVPSNIAEGEGRRGSGDFRRFLNIAHGSLCEIKTQLLLAQRMKFSPDSDVAPALELADEVGRVIHGLLRNIAT